MNLSRCKHNGGFEPARLSKKELKLTMEVIIKNNYREVSELAAQYLLNTVKSKTNAVIGTA